MTQEAREARNAYRREWYKRNPEKRREYESRYWTKKARESAAAIVDGIKAGEPPSLESGEPATVGEVC